MSPLILKIIALLTMTIDHIGLVFGWQGWNLLPFDSTILRMVGRISFPLYAFCLAQGWRQTQNRRKYFLNISIGALASQLPFSLSFACRNLTFIHQKDVTVFRISPYYIFLAALVAVIYWYFVLECQYRHDILVVYLAGLIPGIQWQWGSVCLFGDRLNVLYTFLVSLFLLYIPLRWRKSTTAEQFLLMVAALIFLTFYGLIADYGNYFVGILLILGFSVLKRKEQQALYEILWSLFYYGLLAHNQRYAVACSLAGILIFLYNPRPQDHYRFRAKKFFYIYYPIHLFILGLANVVIQNCL